ncbi:PREDICTED: protein FAM212B [Chaetura pelagica]|uniref:protein FAM212B n=1 Tax=Chaetura pelagica TaxID=8897 RepID=UPI0005238A08|nr:PREDICTED: protein FAM212B [Chaetura pelagica]
MKQLSMKEVGDGLQEQMNCMMGALQELKLLQVQTALEQLEISGGRGRDVPAARRVRGEQQSPTAPKPPGPSLPAALSEGSSLGDTSSSSSSGSLWGEGVYHPKRPSSVLGGAEHAQPRRREPRGQGSAWGQPVCWECPGCDDGHDWTSSLMSQSRNRQPLVLGDNIFADLVGNWLDLPELDKKGEKNEASLAVSRSQELCRKFSLTANIFKKFLRSVRPDRDRLLKEKPCWLPPEDKQPEISKRPKTMNKLKGTFYFPLHGNIQSHHSKAEQGPKAESNREKPKTGTKKVHSTIDYTQSGFDINTAVWV